MIKLKTGGVEYEPEVGDIFEDKSGRAIFVADDGEFYVLVWADGFRRVIPIDSDTERPFRFIANLSKA